MVPLTQALEMVTQERAQTARQLVERDALHQDILERLAAQAAIERSVMLERIDAAEIRAERVEQRLDQVLDALLSERQSANRVISVSWWHRWLRGRG
jgi:hypothetical protein